MKVESPPQSFYLLNIVLIAFESQYEFFWGDSPSTAKKPSFVEWRTIGRWLYRKQWSRLWARDASSGPWVLILISRRGSETGVQREGCLVPVELGCHFRKENGITNNKRKYSKALTLQQIGKKFRGPESSQTVASHGLFFHPGAQICMPEALTRLFV